MCSRFRFNMPEYRHDACKFWLLLLWFAGLILGIVFAFRADDSSLLMMRSAVSAPVSISGLLTIHLLPFLFSALAVYLSKPCFLVVTAFCKAFLIGFCSFAVCIVYESAGWLVCMLLMFSDLCYMPALMFFWLRHIGTVGEKRAAGLAICACAAVLIGVLNYYIVSPFLAMIL